MRFVVMALLFPVAAQGESVIAARNIRPETVLTAADITVVSETIPGAADHPDLALGMEARVAIYAGRPVRVEDLGAPALVERNQIVALHFSVGALSITAEGRVLDRGGFGDVVRVMNLSSKTTVTGVVQADGGVRVASPQG